MIAPDLHEKTSNEFESRNINLPIAFSKQTRSCTLHPISNFISYNALSKRFCSFTSILDSKEIPKNIQEALEVPKWREAVMEEMQAPENE